MLESSNPAMQVYAISASLAVLKLMGQGWMTVYRMMKSNSGLASPEDLRPGPLNRAPRPEQLDIDDYVDRSRRMHRNDLENIPAFLAIGLLFALTEPPLLLAQILMYGFVLARACHAAAYATKQSHEVRATFYTLGSLAVIYMAVHVLVVVVAGYGFG
ncbi:MAPEG family protein [Oricola indica]|uniref:MAPEG family protein n=1 Tax=Oricola indica TaxID=2872591 RepID=UPI001CBAFBD9